MPGIEVKHPKTGKTAQVKWGDGPGPTPDQINSLFESKPDVSLSAHTTLSPQEEQKFRGWYRGRAMKAGIDPNPDNPLHKYDYRGAYKAGFEPEINPDDGLFHWPSEFKDADHPNRFVEGVDTKFNQRIARGPFKASFDSTQPYSMELAPRPTEQENIDTQLSPVRKVVDVLGTQKEAFSLPEQTVEAERPDAAATRNDPAAMALLRKRNAVIPQTSTQENDPEFEARRIAISHPEQLLTDPRLNPLAGTFNMPGIVGGGLKKIGRGLSQLAGSPASPTALRNLTENPEAAQREIGMMTGPMGIGREGQPSEISDIEQPKGQFGRGALNTAAGVGEGLLGLVMGLTPAGAAFNYGGALAHEAAPGLAETAMSPATKFNLAGKLGISDKENAGNVNELGDLAAQMVGMRMLHGPTGFKAKAPVMEPGSLLGNIMPNGEAIIEAAIRVGGKVYRGNSHAEAIEKAIVDGVPEWKAHGNSTQHGFTSDAGNFYTRQQTIEGTRAASPEGKGVYVAEQLPQNAETSPFKLTPQEEQYWGSSKAPTGGSGQFPEGYQYPVAAGERLQKFREERMSPEEKSALAEQRKRRVEQPTFGQTFDASHRAATRLKIPLSTLANK